MRRPRSRVTLINWLNFALRDTSNPTRRTPRECSLTVLSSKPSTPSRSRSSTSFLLSLEFQRMFGRQMNSKGGSPLRGRLRSSLVMNCKPMGNVVHTFAGPAISNAVLTALEDLHLGEKALLGLQELKLVCKKDTLSPISATKELFKAIDAHLVATGSVSTRQEWLRSFGGGGGNQAELDRVLVERRVILAAVLDLPSEVHQGQCNRLEVI